jgi:hypothetical protein
VERVVVTTSNVNAVFESPAAGLLAFLEAAEPGDSGWGSTAPGAVFRHQWAAPLVVDLAGLREGGKVMAPLAQSEGLVLRTFGDLLNHPHPPASLLLLAKEFAKRCLYSPLSAIPHDVARVLYFACIAAALARAGRRISELGDEALTAGMRWAVGRRWINDGARAVLREGIAALAHGNDGDV